MKIQEILTQHPQDRAVPVTWQELTEKFGCEGACQWLEEFYTKQNPLLESNSQQSLNKLQDILSSGVPQPRIGEHYLGSCVTMIQNNLSSVILFQGVLADISHGTGYATYTMTTSDGRQVEFPDQRLSQLSAMITSLYDNKSDFDLMLSELKITYDMPRVDSTLMEMTSAGGIASVAMPMGGMAMRTPPAAPKKPRKKKKGKAKKS